ncbi:hypothetical protein CRYUN_Cryun16bG0060400 [Craigia yunnanensis]
MYWKCLYHEGRFGMLSQRLGNISYHRCCSIRSGDIYSTFPIGDWSCLEKDCFWWFQEPFTSALAYGHVHEEGSNTAAVSQPTTSCLDNCEWIEFSFKLFESIYSYCFILHIFCLSCRGVTKKDTCYEVINIVSFKSLWIGLNKN